MLRTAELNSMRAAAAHSLPDTGELQAPTEVPDGRGGATSAWQTITTTACRIKRLKEPVEVTIADKTTVVCGYKAWFPHELSEEATGEKRLIVNGVTYEIIGAVRDASEEIFQVAFCNRVE